MNGESPDFVYMKNLVEPTEVNQEALEMLFATVNIRTVHKNGVTIYKKDYYDTRLASYFNRKVIVKNYPENIDKVYVFDMEENYICTATAKLITAYINTSEQDFKNSQKTIKSIKESVKKYEPKRNISVYELIAQKQAEEYIAKNKAETTINSYDTAAVTSWNSDSNTEHKSSNISRVMNDYYKKKKQA